MSYSIATPIVVVAAAVFAAGCAQQETKSADDGFSAPVVRTGSNIPVGRERETKPAERSYTEEKLIQDMQRPVTPNPKQP